jgi:DNA-binding GntR family transcriptional regulator
LFDEMKQGAAGTDVWRQAVLHRELHFVPIRASGLRRLTAELERLWEHTDHHRVLYLFKAPSKAREALRQHGDIIEACRTRDSERLIRVHDAHRDFALEHIGRMVAE